MNDRYQSRLYVLLIALYILVSRLSGQTPVSPSNQAGEPGYYRIMVGRYEVTALSDGTVPYPMDQLLTSTTPAAVDTALANFFVSEPYPTSINCFLVNTGNRLILIDTGAGLLLGPTLGKLISNLRASGYEQSQINEIYLTHLHVDHEGGLISDGKPAFPNAILRANVKDVNFWLSPDEANNAAEQLRKNKTPTTKFMQTNFASTAQMIDPYKRENRLKPFHSGEVLAPGITALDTAGHTPGHTVFRIQSDNQSLLIWGDTVHVAEVQLASPTVTIMFDSNPTQAAAKRAAVLTQAASDKTLIAGAHISFPGIGHISRETSGSGFAWIPLRYGQLQPVAASNKAK